MLALTNAKVYVEDGHFEEAVLIENNLISMVGSDEQILTAASACDARIVDCHGKVLIPGLNDSHMHLMQFAESLHQVQIDDVHSIEELVKVCRDFADANPSAVANGMHAIGWNQDIFDDPRMPDRHDLDRISTDYPIVLERICGHILSTNTRAIEMLGLGAASEQYPGGTFTIGEDGYPDGLFYENACVFAKRTVPDFTFEERKAMLLEAMDYAKAHGLTSVQSNDIGAMALSLDDSFRLLRELYESGDAPIRYRYQCFFDTLDDFARSIECGEYSHKDELTPDKSLLTLGPVKLFKDGSLGARTAFVRKPYIGQPDNYGLEWLSDKEMCEYVKLASDNGIQVITHTIGDAAIEHTIDAYESGMVHGDDGWQNPLRHGLVHCQITDDELTGRIIDEEILTLVQPCFLNSDMDLLEGLLGAELTYSSYPFGTFVRESHGLCSYGTDCPVEDCNPFPNIACAVMRTHYDGSVAPGLNPEEQVTVSQAIDAYTAGSAYAMFAEDKLGRILPGYLADLVLLDRDIFTIDPSEIKDVLPIMTIVGGQIVYRR